MTAAFGGRLVASVPEGWRAAESVVVEHHTGDARVIVRAAPESGTAGESFATAEQTRRGELAGYRHCATVGRVAWGGRGVVEHEFEFDDASGTRRHALDWYCTANGYAVRAAASTTAAYFARDEAALRRILEGIDMTMLGPADIAALGGAGRVATPAPTTDPGVAVDWSKARAAWAAPANDVVAGEIDGALYSVEEGLALAALLGAPAFAGIDPAALPVRPARDAVFAAVGRSLRARGVIERDADGALVIAAAHRRRVAPAAVNGLTVIVDRRDAAGPHRDLFAAQADDTARVASEGDGVLRVRALPTDGLVDAVLVTAASGGFTAASDRSPESVPAGRLAVGASSAADEGGQDGVGTVTAVVRVRTLFRSGAGFVGGELAWIQSETGWWHCELDAAEVTATLTPIDAAGVRRELLAHLPA